ncbi:MULTISPECIES: hypothetical protein [Pseudomonas]|uniref:hypothetical protein n=1 Tax=Pseudomonas TaxID=286 RepID=UPI0005FAB402|nr:MULTISPECIES: hypothetical protein [Pseudomonas]KJZ39932.1 hypothetical protein VC33_04185 [Pseudomonas fluorescens]
MSAKQIPSLNLYTHYGKWLPFSLSVEDLMKLRVLLLLRSTETIRLGSDLFHLEKGQLSFGSERKPSDFDIDMEPGEIIELIDECLASA